MITLYGTGFSNNVAKVRYCLNYLGLEYEWVQTNPMKGENKTVEFLAMSPSGKIPAIDVDGFKLFESNSINRYLATCHNSPLYPQDAKQRAIVDAWLDYSSIHVGSMMGRVLFNRVLAPIMGQKVDESSLATGLEFLGKYYPILEAQLTKNAYIAGKDISLADFTLLAIVDASDMAQVSLANYPALSKWRNALKAQPFYQKCYKDHAQYIQESMNAKV